MSDIPVWLGCAGFIFVTVGLCVLLWYKTVHQLNAFKMEWRE